MKIPVCRESSLRGTKYILHGGYATRKNKDNDKFFQEILKSRKKDLNILLVMFAKFKKDYAAKSKQVISQFEKNNLKKKNLSFDIADEKSLAKQIKQVDIIYLQGGDTRRLLKKMRQYKNFEKAVQGKIVAGGSAGAYVLSSYYYSRSRNAVALGLGLVPVKVSCHYEKNKAYEKFLKNIPADLPLLLLPKYKFKVFYQ